MSHTFVICAYKDSPYLSECIESLKKQTVKSRIVIATSTPSDYIEQLAKKYEVGYSVRDGKSSIGADWNYALSLVETTYGTIAHQDDIYEPDYLEQILMNINATKEASGTEVMIAFSDYQELVNGRKYAKRINLIIKKILLTPVGRRRNQGKTWAKRSILRFGNAISCPTVTYNLKRIKEIMSDRENIFLDHFRSNLDWEAWEWLSREEGAFVYVKKPLMAHRIHSESETSAVINESKRSIEDYEMFCKFWPNWFAKFITRAYGQSENSNHV